MTDDWAEAIMTVGIRSMNPEKTIKTMKMSLIDLFASKVSVDIIPYMYIRTF